MPNCKGGRLVIDEKINVELGPRSYEILVRAGSLRQLDQFAHHFQAEHVVVVTDKNVGTIYLEAVVAQLDSIAERVDSIQIEPGEKSKSIDSSRDLWNRLLELNTDRASLIVALGGGVVGDLAGFVAATYARGLPFIQIPTSLLAQVDSSVGGKVGINLARAKNMVGAFWQPKFVLIDPHVLATLDDENYISGLAEVVKYGVIQDADFFASLEKGTGQINNRNADELTKIIAHCCQLKADVVSQDETETTGRRAILNYGHTFGHAIENVFNYGTYLHGQAIAIGMQCAARTALDLQLIDSHFIQRQTQLLANLNLPLAVEPGREDELVAAMHRDKKVSRGKLKLVLPTKIGNVELVESPGDEKLKRAINPERTKI